MRYDPARTSLDRHATYIVTTYIYGSRDTPSAGMDDLRSVAL
jgi:hypothetical protein